MTDIIAYFQSLAEGYKPISHSSENCHFAGSIEEFELLAKSKMKIQEFCMCIETDLAEWVNRNEAETKLIPVHIFIVKSGKAQDFTANYTIMSQAATHLVGIYSRIMKDRREQPNTVARFVDVSSKQLDYIKGEKGDMLFGAVLTITIKLPVNYTFNPSDWN